MAGISTAAEVTFTWANRRDFFDMSRIDDLVFECSWTADEFKKCAADQRTVIKTAAIRGITVGYLIYSLEKHSVTITRIASHPGYQRQGLGRVMLDRLFGGMASSRTHVYAAVPDDLLPAQLFFRSMGFRCTHIIRGESGDRDLYAFERSRRLSEMCQGR